jgi:antitoxin (DNA-binding transcriptional repressor) of toxin-antitoxin stability system
MARVTATGILVHFQIRPWYDDHSYLAILEFSGMKKMAAGVFKTNCLAIMDEVQAKHETVLITKRGKAVAKLIPVTADVDTIYNFLDGKGVITGDIISPVISSADWGELK